MVFFDEGSSNSIALALERKIADKAPKSCRSLPLTILSKFIMQFGVLCTSFIMAYNTHNNTGSFSTIQPVNAMRFAIYIFIYIE